MNQEVDARGLSCPQPVILTLNKIKEVQEGEILVLVDTETARENVSRAAKSKGWTVADIQPADEHTRITLKK
ncbi:MAG: sulfurtransferase TusA family protein [Saccharofermentanales bacterium]